MISISVLGPVELQRDGGAVPVRPGKTTELLVRLALEAGVMVRTERLIEDLWADEAASIARNPLQTKVSRLRRSLGDGSLVTGTRAGYVLNVAPESIDAIEVLRLAGEAAKARASDPAAALAACLHSAMDAEDGDPSAEPRLRAVLQQAHGQHTPDIEIMAMDALARSAANEHDLAAASALLRAADELMPSARHLIGPADRLDADQARTLIEPSHVSKRSGASP